MYPSRSSRFFTSLSVDAQRHHYIQERNRAFDQRRLRPVVQLHRNFIFVDCLERIHHVAWIENNVNLRAVVLDGNNVSHFTHFSRILRYGALLSRGGQPTAEDKARALAGVNPYFYKEYDTAVRNYPVRKAMAAISLLCDYDYLGKGGDGSTVVSDGELLVELTAKLLNL